MTKKQTGFGAIELMVMFSLLMMVGDIIRPADPFFMKVALNPYWGIVLLIALRYGSPLGIVAGMLCAGVYLLGLSLQGIQLSRLLHLDIQYTVYPFAYVLAGGFIGEVIQQHRRRENHLSENATAFQKSLADSEAKRREMDKAYRAIERNMAGQTQTLTDFSESLKKLDTRDSKEIYTALIHILKTQLGFSSCTIWEQTKQGEYLAVHGDIKDSLPSLPRLGQEVLRSRKTMTIRDLLFADRDYEHSVEDGLIAGPLFNSEVNLFAVVVISDVSFSNLTFSAAAKFETFLYWASRSLKQAAADTIKSSSTTRYSDVTMMSYQSFLQFCNVELRMISKDVSSALVFCSICGDIPKEQQDHLNTVLGRVLRYQTHLHDAISWDAVTGAYIIFLPATTADAATLVIQRMSYYINLFNLQPYGTEESLQLEWEVVECCDENNLMSLLEEQAAKGSGEQTL